MSESTLSKYQKEFIDKIALSEGFKNYNVKFDQGSLKGDGYMGTITVVEIEEILTKKKLSLILKAAQKGEELRKRTPVREAYERENYLYEVVFKEFSELQKEYKTKNAFNGFAKYYGGKMEMNEECLVLENLKQIDFKLWDRKKSMDSHHVKAVMAEYGRLHALSYALKKFKPEKFKEMEKNLSTIFKGKLSDDELKDSTVSVMDRAYKAVQNNMEAVNGLRRFMESSQVFFKQTVPIVDKYSVILHGDCWCNNMMFKYDSGNMQKPAKVCFLDWQLSKVGSPVQDISYFFYSCSSKFCMDTYTSYLKAYHDSLTEMLKQFGLKADDFITFKELQIQWRIYSKYGMYMSFLTIKIMLTEEHEAPDLKDLAKRGKNIMDLFEVDISNIEEYNKRVRVVVDHMVKNRLI